MPKKIVREIKIPGKKLPMVMYAEGDTEEEVAEDEREGIAFIERYKTREDMEKHMVSWNLMSEIARRLNKITKSKNFSLSEKTAEGAAAEGDK